MPIRVTTQSEPSKPMVLRPATILRGVEKTSQTKEGAASILEMIRKQVQDGNVRTDSTSQDGGVQVRDMKPEAVNQMMKAIFGENCAECRRRSRQGDHS